MQSLLAPRYYGFGIFAVCCCYLVFQILYIPYLWLGIDELWFAHHIYQYTHSLPYRDFVPYKTVLGYYLLALPFYFSHAVLKPLYFIKDEIAVINVVMIMLACQWAKRWFNLQAIFYTLMIILCGQLFLIYSTELRVDMLTSWLCLLGALFLLSERAGLAGVMLGLAFLVSQKALWYVLASEGALLIVTYVYGNCRAVVSRMLAFNAALLITVGLYIVFWSAYSNTHIVLHSMFYEAYTQAQINFYAPANVQFWKIIINDGPLPILLLPLTLLVLLDTKESAKPFVKQRCFIVLWSAFSLLLIATYQQFFPYNIVFLLPVFFLLYSEFFSWILRSGINTLSLSRRQLFWFLAIYILALIAALICLRLAKIYFLLLLVPFLIFHFCTARKTRGGVWLFGIIVLLTGIYAPLAFFSVTAYQLDGGYQRQTIQLANTLVQPGDNYIAGTFVLYDKDQTVPGFKNLIAPALRYAANGDVSLLPMLVDSLGITAMTSPKMLAALQQYPVKLIINNYRIGGLPPDVMKFLKQEYQHYWGGIYLYAPTIAAGKQQISLKFTGNYLVESQGLVVIDHLQFANDALIPLLKGNHEVMADLAFRLKLVPAKQGELKPEYEHDCPNCFVKPVVY